MLYNKPYSIVIFGPTGVGKTDFALQLGSLISAEIVNMDVGQLYTPLCIGTAKPDWRSSSLAHHLFDYVSDPVNITAVRYRNCVKDEIAAIQKRGNIPLLVGGSGFYLKSLLFPPCDKNSSGGIAEKYEKISDTNTLWRKLYEIDPQRAHMIHPHDGYRIKRALTIWDTTGILPSQQTPTYDPITPFFIIYLTREREQLYQRINERVHVMMQDGWLDEIARLKNTPWESFLRDKKLIGYDDLLDVIAHNPTSDRLEKTIITIQKKSRNYAKRQETMWRGILKQVSPIDSVLTDEVNLTFADLELYIKQLLRKIKYSSSS